MIASKPQAILAALYLAGLASWCHAETITIGAEDDWYPYSGKVNNQAKGMAEDIVFEAFKAVGVDVKFDSLPYARCMESTKSGKLLGCFDTARNSTLENDFLWENKPLFKARINIYVRADSPQSNLKVKDLEGKVVAVTNDYEYGDEFDKNTLIKRDLANQDEQGFKKLAAKRVDYMAAYEKVANSIFDKNKADFAGKFKVAGLITTADLYVSFSKTFPNSAVYVGKFNEGMEAIVKNGKYKAIEANWK